MRRRANAFYLDLERLGPRDDAQRDLKAQAMRLVVDLGQLRTLLVVQSVSSISRPLLIALACWLVIIFFGFSVVAPPNATTGLALLASAFSVAGALFLILELGQPLGGLIRIPTHQCSTHSVISRNKRLVSSVSTGPDRQGSYGMSSHSYLDEVDAAEEGLLCSRPLPRPPFPIARSPSATIISSPKNKQKP